MIQFVPSGANVIDCYLPVKSRSRSPSALPGKMWPRQTSRAPRGFLPTSSVRLNQTPGGYFARWEGSQFLNKKRKILRDRNHHDNKPAKQKQQFNLP